MDNNYDRLVDEAYNLHISGKLEDAKILYENLIKIKPDNLDVLNLYAQLNFLLKNYDIALKYFIEIFEQTKLNDIKINIIKVYLVKKDYENAIKTINSIQNKNIEVLKFLAQSYLGLNDFAKAINIYHQILEMKEHTLSDIFNLSLAYLKNGDYENALKYANEVYSQNNNDTNICLHLVSIYEKLNDIENQIKFSIEAAKLQPNVDLYYNIGVLYRQNGDEETALEYFDAVIELQPNHKHALLNIARIYQNYDKNVSIKIYNELLQKFPKDVNILSQLYIVYKDIMNFSLACDTAKKLVELESDKSYSYSFLGDALYELGKYNEAIDAFEKANKYSEDNEYYNLMIANIYSVLNQGEKAIEIFKNKLGNNLKTDSSYAFIQLKEKNIEEARESMYLHLTNLKTEEDIEKRAVRFFYKLNAGEKYGINEAEFKQYKKFNKDDTLAKIREYLKKDLHGKDIVNKRILLYSANGIGDMIMFSRYIYLLEKYTKNIIIQSPNSMFRLMKYNFPQYKIYSNDNIIDENNYDYSSSFYNLLTGLNEIKLTDIPFSSKYLDVEDELVKEKSELDIMKTDKKKIGIFWMGNPLVMRQRSIKLKEMKPLFDIQNLQIYSFQIEKLDYESEEIKKSFSMIELAPYIKDYADTAAFLKNIDTLVTIDTSIANLAGAMGIKTLLLLPYESEWRWFSDEKTTPWYDSVRIFKQKIPLEWDEVIERVKNELTV